jgi:hypothetical protein
MPPNLAGIIDAILCARNWLNHFLRRDLKTALPS